MKIKYTTVYKIVFGLIVALDTYIAVSGKTRLTNIIIVLVVSALLGICGAILEKTINDAIESDSIVIMFDELFNLKDCTISIAGELYDFDEIDFTFDGCNKEETRRVIDALNRIVKYLKAVGCGRFNYCLFFVPNELLIYSDIVYVCSMLKIDVDTVIELSEYNVYDITGFLQSVMVCSKNDYSVVLKYDEKNNEHFMGIVDKI